MSFWKPTNGAQKNTYEGFEVIEVNPLTRGWMDTTRVRHGISGGGYGITQELMIIAKKALN